LASTFGRSLTVMLLERALVTSNPRASCPPQTRRVEIAKVNFTILQGNQRQKSIPTTSHVVNGSNCRTRQLVEESRAGRLPCIDQLVGFTGQG